MALLDRQERNDMTLAGQDLVGPEWGCIGELFLDGKSLNGVERAVIGLNERDTY